MLDLVLGKPSRNYRRVQFVLPAILAYFKWIKSYGNTHHSRLKLVAGIALCIRCIRNLPLILGLEPPESKLDYAPDYFRATWILTAMDAGFWVCCRIPIKCIRDICSVIATGYYLFAYDSANAMTAKFKKRPTVHTLQTSWEKQKNTIFRLSIQAQLPKIGYSRIMHIPRDPQEWGYSLNDKHTQSTKAHVFYNGPIEAFNKCRTITLFLPGGGWLATDPTNHIQYIHDLATMSDTIIVALDYLKTPQYPYPFASEQCLAFYKDLWQSNGGTIGLSSATDQRRIMLMGDSAGGNIVTGLIIRLIQDKYHLPNKCILMYPCLNLDLKCWMEPEQVDLLAPDTPNTTPITPKHRKAYSTITMNKEASDNRSKSYFDFRKLVQYDRAQHDPSIWSQFGNRSHDLSIEPATATINRGHIAMTSRICYFQDKVLPAEFMRALVLLYVRNSPTYPDIHKDYVLSPLLAPKSILAQFPKTCIIVGDKDPILDDSVLFAAMLKKAKKSKDACDLEMIRGWSHGFFLFQSFLPAAKDKTRIVAKWLNE